MKKTKKQPLRRKIVMGISLVGIGLAVICTRCEKPQGNTAQVSPNASANDGTVGSGLGTIGQMGHQMNTAQAGKSQVNVNAGNGHNANQPTASDSSIQYVTDRKMIDGSTYTGQLKLMSNGLLHPHGRGVCTWPNGTRYDGDFKDGKQDGRGVMTWPNGTRYDGDFKDGKIDGRGVNTRPDGTRYEGDFKDDKYNGRGVLNLPDGQQYEGDFKDGKQDGRGVLNLPDGQQYEGDFKNGKQDGRGVWTYADGRTKEGLWRDDKFVGSQSQESADDNQKSQEASSKFGFVNVTADDPAFKVFADGVFVGNSPAKLKLSEGPHLIEVKKDGFKDYKKEIRVTDGSELNLRAVPEKQ